MTIQEQETFLVLLGWTKKPYLDYGLAWQHENSNSIFMDTADAYFYVTVGWDHIHLQRTLWLK